MRGASGRILTIAGITFTQLVRMKVFGFLGVFAVLLIAAHFFKLPHTYGPESVAEEELRMLKSSAMGAMTLFATLFAVAGTALLLPREVEDRTLYTILCKPVPRLDYLAGKLLGVILTLFVALLCMNLLMMVVLHFRTEAVLAERLQVASLLNWSADLVAQERREVLRHGVTLSLQVGVLAIFPQSRGSSGAGTPDLDLFNEHPLYDITGFLVYVIGHFSGAAREFWLDQQLEVSEWVRLSSHLLSVIFPDFRLYNVIDGAVAGQSLSLSIAGQLTLISMIYLAIYLLLSWFVFAKKEF